MEKTIKVGNRNVKLKTTAKTLRIYRNKFRRDLFVDIQKLEKAIRKKSKNNEDLTAYDLEIFENVAYIMAYQGDPSIPNNIDDWLDTFDTFSIYEILPEILELWNLENQTIEESKKNMMAVAGK